MNQLIKKKFKIMFRRKYHKSDGIKVYTPIKTWSKERKSEYKMRRWEQINTTAEKISE